MTTVPDAAEQSQPSLLNLISSTHGNEAETTLRWACDRLINGETPRDLCHEVINLAAESCSPNNKYSVNATSTRSALGLLPAAAAVIQLAERQENSIRQSAASDTEAARLSSVLIVSLAASVIRENQAGESQAGESSEGASDPPSSFIQSSSALAEFWHATSAANSSLATQSWLSLESADPQAAQDALISAAATRFSSDEQLLILPALLPLATPSSKAKQNLFCATVKQIALEAIDEDRATDQRMQAQLLAETALALSPGTAGKLQPASPERLTALATGIAQTDPEQLAPLLLASFEGGLAPEDLVLALALLRAAAYAGTSSDSDKQDSRVANLCAGIALDAVQLCMARTSSLTLRYELALAAATSPSAISLSSLAELWVPPFDSGGLADTLSAVAEADPESAAEAATAIPPADSESTDAAWCVIRRTVAGDSSLQMHSLMQVTALERGFRSTTHPAKIWFLAAAARSAAQTRMTAQPLAELAEEILS